MRKADDLRLLWGSSWNPPMISCAAIVVPQVAFVAVAPVAGVQFVQVNACWRPLPVTGHVDPQLRSLVPDAPAYVVSYRAGAAGAAETARLQTQYGFTAKDVGAAEFAADLPARVLAQMRCERSIQSITQPALGCV